MFTAGLHLPLFSDPQRRKKKFNQNEPLSGQQQQRNINIVPCISGEERTRCEQKVAGWCNIKMSGFLYLQFGIFSSDFIHRRQVAFL